MWGRVWFLVALVGMGWMFGCDARAADDAANVKNFQHIRILIWSFDRTTGAADGFAEAQLTAGQSVTLEPSAGYRVMFSAGQMAQMTFYGTEQKESALPLTMSHNNGSSEGHQYLNAPDIHLPFDMKSEVNSIAVTLPIGSMQSPNVSQLLSAKFNSDMGQLEDLLIATAGDKHASPDDLMEVYATMKKSARLAQWVAMSSDADPQVAFPALVVAARLGDEPSMTRFFEKCVSSSGNARVKMIELLAGMPPNERVLDMMLKMYSLPEIVVLKIPGLAIGDVDRRIYLVDRIAANYSPEVVHRIKALIDSSKPEEKARVEQRMTVLVERIERMKPVPAPIR